MKIRTPGLLLGHNEIEESVEPAEVGLDGKIFRSLLQVHIDAEKGSGRIALAVQTIARGSYECDRCGDEFEKMSEGVCEIVFIQRDEPFADEEPGDDLRSYGPYQEYIDVSTEVRDALYLSLPMKILCDEDCRGLCPKCGANLNHEPCLCASEQAIR